MFFEFENSKFVYSPQPIVHAVQSCMPWIRQSDRDYINYAQISKYRDIEAINRFREM